MRISFLALGRFIKSLVPIAANLSESGETMIVGKIIK